MLVRIGVAFLTTPDDAQLVRIAATNKSAVKLIARFKTLLQGVFTKGI